MFHFDTSLQAPGALWTILMALSATVNILCHTDNWRKSKWNLFSITSRKQQFPDRSSNAHLVRLFKWCQIAESLIDHNNSWNVGRDPRTWPRERTSGYLVGLAENDPKLI